jgi:hypothetical protein
MSNEPKKLSKEEEKAEAIACIINEYGSRPTSEGLSFNDYVIKHTDFLAELYDKYIPQSESELSRLKEDNERLKKENEELTERANDITNEFAERTKLELGVQEKIYLQADAAEGVDITWCQDRINLNDVCYIRVDKYSELVVALRERDARIQQLEQQLASPTATVLINHDTETIEAVYLDNHKALNVCRENRNLTPFKFSISGQSQQLEQSNVPRWVKAEELLKELCELNHYKNGCGKDDFYEKTQPEVMEESK